LEKIRVLVVDDSLFLRRNLPRILASDPKVEVVDTAADGAEGLQKVKDLRPDVVLLDLMMPVMDGLTALKHIMREAPTPVVMVSATTREGARETLEALALGAVDFVTKPSGPVSLDIHTIRAELVEKVKSAYASKDKGAFGGAKSGTDALVITGERSSSCSESLPEFTLVGGKRLIAIAASTGGPMAIQYLLAHLPADFNAALVVVLHIAPGFTHPLAERLDSLSQITVCEAQDGASIRPGVALIAPAGLHLTLTRSLARPQSFEPGFKVQTQTNYPANGARTELVARLSAEPADALHRPSADVLFNSIARCCAAETCAVILTGMGDDGAHGLRAIREAGGYTVAQDQATSVVYGMPRRAVELGGVDVSLPLEKIAQEIVRVTEGAKS
jgi:two-component system chemotaxis response regulator CheB